jgi:hypothetical protein
MKLRALVPAAALLALSACGGTRFVVIENGSAGAAPPPGSTAPAEEASAEDEEAIREVVAAALTLEEVPFAERSAHVIDGDDLEPTVDATLEITAGLDVVLDITTVTISGTTATATTDVVVDGEPFATDLPVTLEQVDGEWRITRAGACTILALASACPEG